MGLLSLGTPLPWEEAKKYADHVRYHGITQFLNIWKRLKDRQGDELLWGDEVNVQPYHYHGGLFSLFRRFHKIEYMIVELHAEDKNALLSLCQTDILRKLDSCTRKITDELYEIFVSLDFRPSLKCIRF